MDRDVMLMSVGLLGAGIFFIIWGFIKLNAYSKLLKQSRKNVALADLLMNKSSSGISQMIFGGLAIIFSFIYLLINL